LKVDFCMYRSRAVKQIEATFADAKAMPLGFDGGGL